MKYLALSLIIISLIVITLFDKLNIRDIVRDHNSTLYNNSDDTKKESNYEKFIFYILPFLISICLSYLFEITKEHIGLILTISSIFAGLLFNLLVLVIDIYNRETSTSNLRELLKELYYNLSFTILISIVLVIITLISTFNINHLVPIRLVTFLKFIYSSTLYGFVIVFILSLFMILKRIHSILKRNLKK